MLKRLLKIVTCMLLAGMLLATPAFADGTHGFYMECDIGTVNSRADGFMIDFYSDAENALATYYANANWHMYSVPTQKKFNYRTLEGGGSYAGLQIKYRSTQRTGIMSFWRYEYTDWAGNVGYIYADVMMGTSSHYDNEGSGTSCVMDYDWKCGTWYRELIYCWQDIETGETFCGNWYYNYDTDHWDLFVYYNTHLVDSYINSGVSQFLENFSQYYRENVRNFRYRNVYFLSHDNGNWVGAPTVRVWTDGNEKAVGETSMGIGENNSYVWGQVDGTSTVDSDKREEMTVTLNQPEKPATIGKPKIDRLAVTPGSNGTTVSWNMSEHSTPQLSYRLTVIDENNKVLYSGTQTRPNIQSVNLGEINADTYKVMLTVTDVFGQKVSSNYSVGLRGDINQDGVCSISDVTALLNEIQLASGHTDSRYDINQDGILSINDVTSLLVLLKTTK